MTARPKHSQTFPQNPEFLRNKQHCIFASQKSISSKTTPKFLSRWHLKLLYIFKIQYYNQDAKAGILDWLSCFESFYASCLKPNSLLNTCWISIQGFYNERPTTTSTQTRVQKHYLEHLKWQRYYTIHQDPLGP